MIFVGDGDFTKTGKEFLRYFIDLAGLKPHERVLDVGCGIGRMAVPLVGYLDKRGTYEGFDIVRKGIDWCKRNITSRYPNFSFRLADIYNKNYNPEGNLKASEYKFPYPDESFDFTFLASVFTHMLPEDMGKYFSEISRTLKRGGRCLITFFLLNDESLRLIDNGESAYHFRHIFPGYRTINTERPESAVAYDEGFISGLFAKNGLEIKYPVHYGSWCGRRDFLSCQDIIVASKGPA